MILSIPDRHGEFSEWRVGTDVRPQRIWKFALVLDFKELMLIQHGEALRACR
jgi:hypothetical protein